jgi:hypothetical protein
VSRNIIETKRTYYDKQISNSNDRIKSTWNIVKSLTGRKPNHEVIPILSTLHKSYTNPKTISDSFNKYYLSVAETIINNSSNNTNLIEECNKPSEYLFHIFKVNFPTINYNFVTTNEIENIINKLKITNSYGYDEIPVKILKSCTHFIISPLTYIINRSLATGTFPDRLKFSEIKPIYKNGIRILLVIIDPCHYYLPFQRYLRE